MDGVWKFGAFHLLYASKVIYVFSRTNAAADISME
jgi:hypothetical protein